MFIDMFIFKINEFSFTEECFSFHRANEKTFGQNSGWLFLDAAESLFVVSESECSINFVCESVIIS